MTSLTDTEQLKDDGSVSGSDADVLEPSKYRVAQSRMTFQNALLSYVAGRGQNPHADKEIMCNFKTCSVTVDRWRCNVFDEEHLLNRIPSGVYGRRISRVRVSSYGDT
jgi:hypothetical protein